MRSNPRTQEIKTARSQIRKLNTMLKKLQDMSSEWDGLSGALEYEIGNLAEAVEGQISLMKSEIDDWKKAPEGEQE